MAGALKDMLHAVRSTPFRSLAHRLWYLQRLRGLRGRIFCEYGGSADPEVAEVLAYLERHPAVEVPMQMTPPYEWVQQYRPEEVRVEPDAESGLLTTHLDGHRVFFPRETTVTSVQRAVAVARMEQDPRSPHGYLSGAHCVDPGDVAVFIGASDGIFCLSLIDRLSKAYLFEPDPAWAEPLRATLRPWKDKVEVVPQALGSRHSGQTTTLDYFLAERGEPNFIQMDVEGMEGEVLAGAGAVLQKARKLRLSVCTYHQRLDFPEFAAFLGGLGYAIHHSPGFYVLGVRMPYLRRGILYASRGDSA
jgi:hypothetical protein